MRFSSENRQLAVSHLQAGDAVIGSVIDRVGPFRLRLRRQRFAMLVRSIISQQISVNAATSIRNRLFDLVDQQVEPHRIAALPDSQLRSAGISPQKMTYLRDLSQRVAAGNLQLSQIGRYDDEAVIQQLTVVRGIGLWTAQMFLIFALGRLDVLPHGDVGIQNAIQSLYGLRSRPDRQTIEEIARPWRPFASAACWYCWRSLDALPK